MNTKNSIKDLGVRAKKAAGLLANISNDQKNKALNNLKKNLEFYSNELIEIKYMGVGTPPAPASAAGQLQLVQRLRGLEGVELL